MHLLKLKEYTKLKKCVNRDHCFNLQILLYKLVIQRKPLMNQTEMMMMISGSVDTQPYEEDYAITECVTDYNFVFISSSPPEQRDPPQNKPWITRDLKELRDPEPLERWGKWSQNNDRKEGSKMLLLSCSWRGWTGPRLQVQKASGPEPWRVGSLTRWLTTQRNGFFIKLKT